MSQKEYSAQEVRQALAKAIRERIEVYAGDIQRLRAREVAPKSLKKAELCPICGNVDRPDSCSCLRKSDAEGVPLALAELCKKCGKKHLDKCAMAKDELPPVGTAPEQTSPGAKLPGKAKEVPAEGSGGKMEKGTMDMVMGKEKFKAGPMGKPSLPGLTPPKAPGVPGKQPVGKGGGDSLKVAGGALDPKSAAKAANTAAVATANKEMGGFQSLMANPTGSFTPATPQKTKGGKGFLAGLVAKFGSSKPAMPTLERSEKAPADLKKSTESEGSK